MILRQVPKIPSLLCRSQSAVFKMKWIPCWGFFQAQNINKFRKIISVASQWANISSATNAIFRGLKALMLGTKIGWTELGHNWFSLKTEFQYIRYKEQTPELMKLNTSLSYHFPSNSISTPFRVLLNSISEHLRQKPPYLRCHPTDASIRHHFHHWLLFQCKKYTGNIAGVR